MPRDRAARAAAHSRRRETAPREQPPIAGAARSRRASSRSEHEAVSEPRQGCRESPESTLSARGPCRGPRRHGRVQTGWRRRRSGAVWRPRFVRTSRAVAGQCERLVAWAGGVGQDSRRQVDACTAEVARIAAAVSVRACARPPRAARLRIRG